MIFYRLSKCIYIADLSGNGARLYGGRWNSAGQPMVYMAQSRSLAILEVLAHVTTATLPAEFCIAEIDVPTDSVFAVEVEFLPADWQSPSPMVILKQLGDLFLAKSEFLLMKVPSILVPEEFNYLLNPLHPDAQNVKLINTQPFQFDKRLL